jgi:hypothetical protein
MSSPPFSYSDVDDSLVTRAQAAETERGGVIKAAAAAFDASFTVLSAWISVLLPQLQPSFGASQSLMQLIARLVECAYYVMGSDLPGDCAAVLAGRLSAVAEALGPAQTRALQDALMRSEQPWLAVLGAWLSDSVGAAAAATVGNGDVSSALRSSSSTRVPGALVGDDVVEEFFLLQEAAVQCSNGGHAAAVALWQEIFLRYARDHEVSVCPAEIMLHAADGCASGPSV